MNRKDNMLSNINGLKVLFLSMISILIPYFGGIIFSDAFSKYYYIRKCDIIDASILNICSIINIHYILMINIAGMIMVASAILLLKFNKIHNLNFRQVNLMYLCFYSFIIAEYVNQGLLIIIASSIFALTYFILIRSKHDINTLNLTIMVIFVISVIYPFAKGFKDFVYYYTEDKWISFSDFPKHNTGKEVWSKSIQTLLLGINELKLKDFSTIEIGDNSFISVAAWPIRHLVHGRSYGYKRGSRWIVHKELVQLEETELNTEVFPLSRLNRTLVGDNKLTQFARCKLKWSSNGIHISYC